MKAYPYMHKHPTSGQTEIAAGMDLRDWFAGKALSSPICLELSSTNNWDNERRSEWAYKQADEMMKQRQIKDVPNE